MGLGRDLQFFEEFNKVKTLNYVSIGARVCELRRFFLFMYVCCVWCELRFSGCVAVIVLWCILVLQTFIVLVCWVHLQFGDFYIIFITHTRHYTERYGGCFRLRGTDSRVTKAIQGCHRLASALTATHRSMTHPRNSASLVSCRADYPSSQKIKHTSRNDSWSWPLNR